MDSPSRADGHTPGRSFREGSTKRYGEFLGGRVSRLQNVRRWDGAARTSYLWDNLRRDPELWDNHGNCFVHLYGQGQSRRGPAFKLPFSVLVEQSCAPLIERFVASEEPRGRSLHRQYRQPPQIIPEHRAATGAEEDRIDLYIPAPPGSDKHQALSYHLATRNFFAWLLRRSMVGEHLGGALVGLLASMHEFRDDGVDNVLDLVDYLDEEGYLDFVGQPNNALAVLQLAESFQLREIYIDAFAHCVGMCETLYRSCEYQCISPKSRRLIRQARAEMDTKLGRAGAMLGTFLEEDLSEAHLGLTADVRAHLDRFRGFIRDFYAAKFGRFPPPMFHADEGGCQSSSIFTPEFYRAVAADFEALYEYLVDDRFSAGDASSGPPSAQQGGLCVLQSVDEFERRRGYPSLAHPFPLLPEIAPKHRSGGLFPAGGGSSASSLSLPSATSSRRLSWLATASATAERHLPHRHSRHAAKGKNKLRADGRLVAHAALMRATNVAKVHLLGNDMVCAFRRFEESSVVVSASSGTGGFNGSAKSRSAEKKNPALSAESLADARKVRWVLVYCVYQTVRGCVPAAAEEGGFVSGMEDAVPYHTAVDVSSMRMPWEDDRRGLPAKMVMRSQTQRAMDQRGAGNDGTGSNRSSSLGMDIKPDVDYYALTHRGESERTNRSKTSLHTTDRVVIVPPRRSSLTRSLSRHSTIRRSLSMFQRNSIGSTSSLAGSAAGAAVAGPLTPPLPTREALPRKSSRRRSMYQEIVVQGYGNGTNHVNFGSRQEEDMPADPQRQATTDGASEGGDDHTPSSPSGAASLTLRSPSTASNTSAVSTSTGSAAASFATAATTAPSSPMGEETGYSFCLASTATPTAEDMTPLPPATPRSLPPPALPTRSPARLSLIIGGDPLLAMQPRPLCIQKGGGGSASASTHLSGGDAGRVGNNAIVSPVEGDDEDDEWPRLVSPMTAPASPADELVDAWDQFPGLGGHRSLLPGARPGLKSF